MCVPYAQPQLPSQQYENLGLVLSCSRNDLVVMSCYGAVRAGGFGESIVSVTEEKGRRQTYLNVVRVRVSFLLSWKFSI